MTKLTSKSHDPRNQDLTLSKMEGAQKYAVVVGGASGIGRACAHALADSGYLIGIIDRDRDRAIEVLAEITDRIGDGRGAAIAANVTDWSSVSSAIARFAEDFGRISAAVNAAGIQGPLEKLENITPESWRSVLDINLTGLFYCMKAELMWRAQDQDVSIVNIASNFGLVGKARISPYVASKHGVVGLTKAAALDYARERVRINAVCPGPVQTPLLEALAAGSGDGPKMLDEVSNSIPMQRVGLPREIALAVTWLCSDSSAFVTGASIPVDGGFTVGR